MRIALATVGTTGDIRPFLVLGMALRTAGHDVVAITWPVHAGAFREVGLPVETAGPQADADEIVRVADAAAARSPMAQIAVLRDFHLQDGAHHLRRLRGLLEGFDVVVLHGIHVLAHAAVLDLGVPHATAVFDPVLIPTRTAPPPGMPSLGPANGLAWAALDRMLRRIARPLDAVLADAGSGQRRLPLFRARSPLLHLVACSPALIRVPPDLPAGAHITGAWLASGPAPGLPDAVEAFLASGRAPVVITFGSIRIQGGGAVDDAVSRLVDAGHRVIVQGSTDVGGPAVLNAGAIEHRGLFPRAAVVVHHGGAGTTHTAAAAGVPSVVVPHVADQPYWADRLARLGVAPPPVPFGRMTGERLASAVQAAMDPRMRERAGELSRDLAAEVGPHEATRLLLEVFGRGPSEHR